VCGAETNEVEVDESDSNVRLRAVTNAEDAQDSPDCADGLQVVLEQPVGTRVVVDEFDDVTLSCSSDGPQAVNCDRD